MVFAAAAVASNCVTGAAAATAAASRQEGRNFSWSPTDCSTMRRTSATSSQLQQQSVSLAAQSAQDKSALKPPSDWMTDQVQGQVSIRPFRNWAKGWIKHGTIYLNDGRPLS